MVKVFMMKLSLQTNSFYLLAKTCIYCHHFQRTFYFHWNCATRLSPLGLETRIINWSVILCTMPQCCYQNWRGKFFLFLTNSIVQNIFPKRLKGKKTVWIWLWINIFSMNIKTLLSHVISFKMVGCLKFELVIVNFCLVIEWWLAVISSVDLS